MKNCEPFSRELDMPFDVPPRISAAIPDPRRLALIRQTLTKSVKPVRPLPSNGTMMLLCVGVFILLAILLAMPGGFPGFVRGSGPVLSVEYGVSLLLALALAGAVVERMIPGSRHTIPPAACVVLTIVLLSVTATLLFHDPKASDFVRQGIPCLRLGLLCAIPAACLTVAMVRRGFVTDTLSAGTSAGALSGLLGTAVLELHCPVFSATHIIAWHAGVIAVTSLAGALSGWVLARVR
jgi:hypothetical protein